jgi:hypothetical protein
MQVEILLETEDFKYYAITYKETTLYRVEAKNIKNSCSIVTEEQMFFFLKHDKSEII